MKKFSFLFVLATLLVGCGGGGQTGSGETQEEPKSMLGSDEEINLVLNANDLMKYDKKELRVQAGQTVTLTLNHTGQMGVEVMGHNFVLLQPGTDLTAFATAAMNAKDNDYIPEGSEAVIVHTKMIGGGESTSITFEAPAPGIYDYICSFPGHYAAMQGKFFVE